MVKFMSNILEVQPDGLDFRSITEHLYPYTGLLEFKVTQTL